MQDLPQSQKAHLDGWLLKLPSWLLDPNLDPTVLPFTLLQGWPSL